jgi:hypothetical protein
MFERTISRSLILTAMFALLGCGQPQQRVVDQYFGAVNAGDDATLGSFSAYKFTKKVGAWKILSATDERTVEAALPGLTQQLTAAQKDYDDQRKVMQGYATEHGDEYRQAQDLKIGTKPPAKLVEMVARLDAWAKTERELKRKIADAKIAADAERKLVKLSWGADAADIDTAAADMVSRDLTLQLVVDGQPQVWTMHVRKYNPKQSTGRGISRWVVQALEPKA